MKRQYDESKVLERFMKEEFDFKGLKECGFYPKDMKRNDYEGQAKRVCEYFGYKTVYEYGAKEVICHLSEKIIEGENKPFVTVIPSIYE